MLSKPKKVIIVGAGAAGMQAAATLLSTSNFEVQILEASNRIGGRLLEMPENFANFPIELGAAYIHGHKSSNWVYAQQAGAKMYNLKDLKTLVNVGGVVHEEKKFYEIDPDLKSIFDDWYELNLNKVKLDEDITLKEYARRRAEAFKKPFAYDFVFRSLAHEWAADWSKLSVKAMQEMDKELEDFIDDEEDPGDFENYAIAPPVGQSQIFKKAFGHLFEHVKLNSRITEVNYEAEKVVLKDDLGETYSADAVIVTVPLTILKKGTIAFKPGLPKSKMEAIKKLEMGCGGKVFVKFKKNLWGDCWGLVNDGFIIQYNAAGYFSEPHLNNVIEGFVAGPEAEHLSKITKEEQKEILKKDLQPFFGTESFDDNYEDHFYFGWESVPDIWGAYAYPGSADAAELRKALQKAIDNKLYFAGEATDYCGYAQALTGAYDSGKRAAEEIIKNFDLKVTTKESERKDKVVVESDVQAEKDSKSACVSSI